MGLAYTLVWENEVLAPSRLWDSGIMSWLAEGVHEVEETLLYIHSRTRFLPLLGFPLVLIVTAFDL